MHHLLYPLKSFKRYVRYRQSRSLAASTLLSAERSIGRLGFSRLPRFSVLTSAIVAVITSSGSSVISSAAPWLSAKDFSKGRTARRKRSRQESCFVLCSSSFSFRAYERTLKNCSVGSSYNSVMICSRWSAISE